MKNVKVGKNGMTVEYNGLTIIFEHHQIEMKHKNMTLMHIFPDGETTMYANGFDLSDTILNVFSSAGITIRKSNGYEGNHYMHVEQKDEI